MSLAYPDYQEQSLFKKSVKIFFLVFALLLLFFFIVYQTYQVLHRGEIEKLFDLNKNFSILLVGSSPQNDDKENVIFISVATVYPQTSKIGLISFFPETRLKENTPTLSQRLQEEDISKVSQDLATIMGVEIPFYIKTSLSTVSEFVDLVEGVPYYIWQPDVPPQENFPQGEFILDGSLIKKLLNMKVEGEFFQAKRLYRQYSFLLNFWKERSNKWQILRDKDIFKKASGAIKSNLQISELYFLSQVLMSEKAWLPLFMEVSAIKKGDNFVMDAETTALFLKDFQKKLSKQEENFNEESPRMEIRNGTDTSGLARKMRNKVAQRGVRVLEFSNADRNDYPKTILIDRSANVNFVQNFSLLMGADYYFSINRSIFTDIVVIIGNDYHDLKFRF